MLQVRPEESNCVVMSWSTQDQTLLVAINLGNMRGEVKTPLPQKWKNSEVINDLLNSKSNPSYAEFVGQELILRLPAYKACILSC